MTSELSAVDYLASRLRVRVLGGFEEYQAILESIPDEVYDELRQRDRPIEAELVARTRAAIEETSGAAKTWPDRTMNDAIDAAFAELSSTGIVALQNAGYTMSDGWSDVSEEASDRVGVRGAAFYHGQDLERAVAGHGLDLAFGSLGEGADQRALSAAIGREVCAMLAKHGVVTEWNGSVEQRIRIPPLEWRRQLRPTGS